MKEFGANFRSLRWEFRLRFVLFVIVIASLILLWPPRTHAQQAEAPAYRGGDKWTVNWESNVTGSRSDMLPNGVYAVFYRDGKFLWCPSKANTPVGAPCSDPWEGLREEEAVMFFGEYKRGVPFIAFPMKVGDERIYKYGRTVWRGRREEKIDLTGKISVSAVEKIKIGTSERDAYKHDMSEEGGNVSRVYKYYYSPDCKCIARLSAVFGSGSSYALQVLSYETKP